MDFTNTENDGVDTDNVDFKNELLPTHTDLHLSMRGGLNVNLTGMVKTKIFGRFRIIMFHYIPHTHQQAVFHQSLSFLHYICVTSFNAHS